MHALHSPRVREQRAPASRAAIFSPSVCLSAVGFVRLQRRPSAPRHRLGPEPPCACRGPVPESPGPAGPSCGLGPIVQRSVCPEAGPRDPERRGAPRRRVKGPPTPSLRGQAENAGAPRSLLGRRLSVLLSVSGDAARGSLWPGGRGQPALPPCRGPGFRDEDRPDRLPAVGSSFSPSGGLESGRAVRAAALPAWAQVGSAGRAGTAAASDRRGGAGGGEDGRGGADPGGSPSSLSS